MINPITSLWFDMWTKKALNVAHRGAVKGSRCDDGADFTCWWKETRGNSSVDVFHTSAERMIAGYFSDKKLFSVLLQFCRCVIKFVNRCFPLALGKDAGSSAKTPEALHTSCASESRLRLSFGLRLSLRFKAREWATPSHTALDWTNRKSDWFSRRFFKHKARKCRELCQKSHWTPNTGLPVCFGVPRDFLGILHGRFSSVQ